MNDDAWVGDATQQDGAGRSWDESVPYLLDPSLTARLGDLGDLDDDDADTKERFVVGEQLGTGATGSVYAVFDRTLRRTVAIKCLRRAKPTRRDIAQFLHEARVTAALEHPNVLPVHTIDLTADGRPYIAMKRLEGQSLGAALASSTRTQRHPSIADGPTIVPIVIAVAHALAFAHRRNIVHRDVKPDNILVGDLGEVLLVDWGSAGPSGTGRGTMAGTPLYMAPEQARREDATARSDVYALGATLFHLLTLTPPTIADEPESFWRRKQQGLIDEPDPAALIGVPRPLLAIARTALDPDPQRRYADAAAFAADLIDFQNGQNLAVWGAPTISEDFGPGWQDRWWPMEGSFHSGPQGLTTTGQTPNSIFLRHRLDGDVAITYEATRESTAQAGDISLCLIDELRFDSSGSRVKDYGNPMWFQFGGWYGTQTSIRHYNAYQASHDLHPEAGRTYRIRIEIHGRLFTLSVDDQEVCRYHAPLPFSSGHLGLYGVNQGQRFAHLRIYQRGVPERVPVLAIGDGLLRHGNIAAAHAEYERVARSHQGTLLADEAVFQSGMCLLRLRSLAAAEESWARIGDRHWQQLAQLERSAALFSAGRHHEALEVLRTVAATDDPRLRERAAAHWNHQAMTAVRILPASLCAAYLDLHAEHFLSMPTTDRVAAMTLNHLDRCAEVVARFPRQRYECTIARERLGLAQEAVDGCADLAELARETLLTMAHFDLIERQYPEAGDIPERRLVTEARYEELLRRNPQHIDALIETGAAAETLARTHGHDWQQWARATMLLNPATEMGDWQRSLLPVMLVQGRLDEAAQRFAHDRESGLWVRYALAAAAWKTGDPAPLTVLADLPLPALLRLQRHDWSQCPLVHFILAPCLLRHPASLSAYWQHLEQTHRWSFGQRLWHAARYLRDGDEAALRRQPHRRWLDGDAALLRAVRSTIRGEPDAAQWYASYHAVPAWKRGWCLDPATDGLVEALQRGLPIR